MTARRCARLGLAAYGAALILSMTLGAWTAWAANVAVVTQLNRKFNPPEVEVARGATVRFVNDDGTLLHHVYTTSPSFDFDSGEQEPGKIVEERFSVPGTYTVLCGIHPKMHLKVVVQ